MGSESHITSRNGSWHCRIPSVKGKAFFSRSIGNRDILAILQHCLTNCFTINDKFHRIFIDSKLCRIGQRIVRHCRCQSRCPLGETVALLLRIGRRNNCRGIVLHHCHHGITLADKGQTMLIGGKDSLDLNSNSHHNATSGQCVVIRPFHEMISAIWSCRQMSNFIFFIKTTTCDCTHHCIRSSCRHLILRHRGCDIILHRLRRISHAQVIFKKELGTSNSLFFLGQFVIQLQMNSLARIAVTANTQITILISIIARDNLLECCHATAIIAHEGCHLVGCYILDDVRAISKLEIDGHTILICSNVALPVALGTEGRSPQRHRHHA